MPRRRLIATLAIAGLAAGGCTTTRQIRRPDALAQIEQLHTKDRYRMTLLHEQPPGATSSVPPSLLLDPGAAASGEVAPLVDLSNLRGYRIKRHGRGVADGVVVGVPLGALAGAIVGYSGGDDPPCMMLCGAEHAVLSRWDKAVFVGILGGFVGAVVGAVIGAAIGHTDEYVFRDARDDR